MPSNTVHRIELVGESLLFGALGSAEYDGIVAEANLVGFETAALRHEVAQIAASATAAGAAAGIHLLSVTSRCLRRLIRRAKLVRSFRRSHYHLAAVTLLLDFL